MEGGTGIEMTSPRLVPYQDAVCLYACMPLADSGGPAVQLPPRILGWCVGNLTFPRCVIWELDDLDHIFSVDGFVF